MWNGDFCICAVLDISPLDRMEVEKEMQVRETGRVRLGLPSGDPETKDRYGSTT